MGAAERKTFDLGEYVEVKDRIKLFYELYGHGRLTTERVEVLTAPDGKQRVMVHAQAFRTPDDPHPGDGYSWLEIPGTTPYTKGSEVENAETSAWGRAIGSLGILIDRSIASQNEIDAKADESRPNLTVVKPSAPSHEATADGGLIGTVQVGDAPADFEIRQEEARPALSFKLMDGRKGFRVVARGEMAIGLALIRDQVIGQRVTCWGRMGTDTFNKGSQKITYNVLDLDRIAGADFLLPDPMTNDAANADEARGGVVQEPTAEPSAPTTSAPVDEEGPEPPAQPEAPSGAREPVDAPVGPDEPSPVLAASGGSRSSGPAALCGSPSPYGDDFTCALAPGHKGVHKQFQGLGTTWSD